MDSPSIRRISDLEARVDNLSRFLHLFQDYFRQTDHGTDLERIKQLETEQTKLRQQGSILNERLIATQQQVTLLQCRLSKFLSSLRPSPRPSPGGDRYAHHLPSESADSACTSSSCETSHNTLSAEGSQQQQDLQGQASKAAATNSIAFGERARPFAAN
ncbi:hypothetical protein PAPYR_722 [Paratrimastix pyriformis]|uniref:Uncharacterized protein n=1 Tax=Paratrimastix pyriformis TaxID=342808 RepID=A0ABQ8UYR2_9EUKA|nr:hypothetical protein PAPYR_722 [Paratrimastix pyriformis]